MRSVWVFIYLYSAFSKWRGGIIKSNSDQRRAKQANRDRNRGQGGKNHFRLQLSVSDAVLHLFKSKPLQGLLGIAPCHFCNSKTKLFFWFVFFFKKKAAFTVT